MESNELPIQIYDLSVAFAVGMPRYPASWFPEFAIREVAPESMPEAQWKRRFTSLEFFVHNGTHVESKEHVFSNGSTIDHYPLSKFAGFPVVLDFTGVPNGAEISASSITSKLANHPIPQDSIILIRTTYNDRHWTSNEFWDHSPYLGVEAARVLAETKPKLVGLDFQTERPGETNFVVHRELFAADVLLCEYLFNLDCITPDCFFMAMPIKVQGVEAAAVPAIALKGL